MLNRNSNTAVLLLGSNLGNKKQHLENACELLNKQLGTVVNASSLYESEAWGNTNQDSFYNKVVVLETQFNLLDCFISTQTIERTVGRVKLEHWGPRILDIDILFFNNKIISGKVLKVPHPYITARRFTLMPLNEILPNYIHPIEKKKVSDLLDICTDTGKVWKVTNEV